MIPYCLPILITPSMNRVVAVGRGLHNVAFDAIVRLLVSIHSPSSPPGDLNSHILSL